MTVPVQNPIVSYVANGISTMYVFPFRVLVESDLTVTVDGSTPPMSFTVSGLGQDSGWVTFSTPPAAGAKILLFRGVALMRAVDYQDNGDLLADTVNADLDRIWMALQGQGYIIGSGDPASSRALLLGRDDVSGSGAYRANGNRIAFLGYPTADTDAATYGSARDIAEQVAGGVVGGYGFFLQDGAGAAPRTFQDKQRETVSAADYFHIGDLDFTSAIQRAINYLASKTGGTVLLPRGSVPISQTIVVSTAHIFLQGAGGAFDGNQPFQDTWANIVANAGTRLVWQGAPPSFMFLHSPPDVLAPVSAPLQGGGFDGIMFDCNNIAQYGVKILSTRGARYTNSSVVRHTTRGMVLGVTVNDLYDGGSGTNTSLSLCEFENIVVSTAMLPGNTAKSVLMYGNGLKGGVNQCVFKSCQWFNADYTSRHIDIENTDDNTFIHCRWNGKLALHASDTGTNPVSNAFPGSLSQNHFFDACVGITEVLTTINPISLTNLPSFGHIATSRSGNLPGFTVVQQMIVGAGADMTVIGDTLDFANRLGAMTWGAQPAITNCYLSAAQAIANATLSKLTWAGSQYDRLQGWKSATPTDIVVPNNIKWMTATLNVSWAANSTGERYAGIFLAGGPVGQDRRLASGNAEQPVTTGVIPVTPGQIVDARVSQTSGGSLNVANIARLTVEWH